jgi:hypothetical protein
MHPETPVPHELMMPLLGSTSMSVMILKQVKIVQLLPC